VQPPWLAHLENWLEESIQKRRTLFDATVVDRFIAIGWIFNVFLPAPEALANDQSVNFGSFTANFRELVGARVSVRVDPKKISEVRNLENDGLLVQGHLAGAVLDILIRAGHECGRIYLVRIAFRPRSGGLHVKCFYQD